jgi:urease accessory protein
MIRAVAVVRRPAIRPEATADVLTLDHEGRQRRRVALTCDGGLRMLLDLEKPARLDDGDALALEDGRLVLVKAAAEPLYEITAATPLRLARLAWHIGNRHAAADIDEESILIERDPVLAEMARGLGATVREVVRPFRPERGAYAHAHGHGRDG